MSAVYGPHSWFWHETKKRFLDQIWCFFYNKTKILTILFIVKYEKITVFDEYLVLLGPIISKFFACSNEKKINKNIKGCSGTISMHWVTIGWLGRKMTQIQCCITFSTQLINRHSKHFFFNNILEGMLYLKQNLKCRLKV